MKKLLNKIKIIGSAGLFYAIAINPTLAQSNIEVNVQAFNLSNQIKFQMIDFETNATEIETNQALIESQKLLDEKIGRMGNSIETAIHTLKFSPGNMDRKQQAILWLGILSAIDRHLSTNIPSVDISGFVHPPRGYKGKVGPWGMLPPDTNDVANYTYYVATVNADKENAKKAHFQHTLHRINDWEATPDAEEFLRGAYSSSEADKQELGEFLKQSSLSDARKQKLEGYFNKVH